ncbi:MAG: aminotransferase class V-fold PLP-dependent enzyme [Polyangiaceae bacterium]|nr:aminotransferase class V-fold PLP-dependent enzyme [Polyangiaceae bacterium]
MTAVDWTALRGTFPTLLERSYFASQCMGPFPRGMLDDLAAYGRSLARRSRALEEWAERWFEMHGLTEDLIGAPRGSVFLRDSATAVSAAIASAIEPQGERRRIVMSTGDFHSIRYMWSAQARRGFEVVHIDANGTGHGDAATFVSAIDERVRVVALSLVSPRSGALLDTRPIVEAARRAGALVVIDAYQALGVVPVDVRRIGADAIVGGFHKWVGGGGTGLAFGYVAPEVAATLEPVYPGWLGHARLLGFSDKFEPGPGATKFQQGMAGMEPIYTSRAGLRFVLETGVEEIRRRNVALSERILERAAERGLPVRSPLASARRGGMICFDLPDGDKIVSSLAELGIDVDYRPGAGVRVGAHPCATEDECDRLVDHLARSRPS